MSYDFCRHIIQGMIRWILTLNCAQRISKLNVRLFMSKHKKHICSSKVIVSLQRFYISPAPLFWCARYNVGINQNMLSQYLRSPWLKQHTDMMILICKVFFKFLSHISSAIDQVDKCIEKFYKGPWSVIPNPPSCLMKSVLGRITLTGDKLTIISRFPKFPPGWEAICHESQAFLYQKRY